MVFNCPSAGDSGSEAGVTTKQIPYGILPIPTFPNQGKEHSVGFLLTWEGGLQDTLPNSGEGEESHPQVGEGTTVSSSIRGMSILSSIEFTFLNQKSNFSKYIFFIYT